MNYFPMMADTEVKYLKEETMSMLQSQMLQLL